MLCGGAGSLRVRRSDAGFAVSLRYRDQGSALREPYLCYLSGAEWARAKAGGLPEFVESVEEKMRRRKPTPGLNDLIERLESMTERRAPNDRAV